MEENKDINNNDLGSMFSELPDDKTNELSDSMFQDSTDISDADDESLKNSSDSDDDLSQNSDNSQLLSDSGLFSDVNNNDTNEIKTNDDGENLNSGLGENIQQEYSDATLNTNIEATNSTDSLITVRPVKFQHFSDSNLNLSIKKNLDILQDIPMHITVELGRTKSTIKDIINMGIGSVVELNKIAGEQVEIYVNDKLVAKGEVIVIEDKFGVRVVSTNIPKEAVYADG